MQLTIALTALLATPTASVSSYQGPQTPFWNFKESCNCAGTRYKTKEADKTGAFVCDDTRLGPKRLPLKFPLLSIASDYDRFGPNDLTPGEFLSKYWNATSGYWIYPPLSGFQLDVSGAPISSNMMLNPPVRVDRFGSEGGHFIAAADAPFAQRALPPDALNICPEGSDPTKCNATTQKDAPYNYHLYEVVKAFQVVGGPIATAFEQPGLGAQFYLGAMNVSSLIDRGYLKRLNLTEEELGPGSSVAKCGKPTIECHCREITNG